MAIKTASTEWNSIWNAARTEAQTKHRTTGTAALKAIRSRIVVGHGGPESKSWDSDPHASGFIVGISDILAERNAL